MNANEGFFGRVVTAVCGMYELQVADLVGKGRTPWVAEARFVAMYLSRAAGFAAEDIGRSFGRSGADVDHGCRRVVDWCGVYDEVSERVEILAARVGVNP